MLAILLRSHALATVEPSPHLARCDVIYHERDVKTDPRVDAIESTQSTIPRRNSDWPKTTDWTLMPLSSLICFE